VILLVLSDSTTNRRLLSELLGVLGPEYATSSRSIIRSLRKGEPLAGSGIVLV
jgi:hypothetical protein